MTRLGRWSITLPALLALLAGVAAVLLPDLVAGKRHGMPSDAAPTVRASDLPAEAREVLARLRDGGPFEYAKDGDIFRNRERALPPRPVGYYREYTVRTPGSRDRGARRIVTGREGDLWYTDDHYRSFRRIEER